MSGPGARRAAVLAREARRLDGNRLWRIETPAGPLLQKYYVEKGGRLRSGWRSAWSRLLRGATGSGAAERWRVEGETLAHWRAAGVDVPADRTAEFPRYAGERVRLLEWIEGRTLAELLAGAGLAGEERSALLRRAAAAWGRRLVEDLVHFLAVRGVVGVVGRLALLGALVQVDALEAEGTPVPTHRLRDVGDRQDGDRPEQLGFGHGESPWQQRAG